MHIYVCLFHLVLPVRFVDLNILSSLVRVCRVCARQYLGGRYLDVDSHDVCRLFVADTLVCLGLTCDETVSKLIRKLGLFESCHI